MARLSAATRRRLKEKEERLAAGAKKRVAILLRVSTKKQVSEDEDAPIPVQRQYLLDMINERPDWVLATRLEDGVEVPIEYAETASAYRLSKDERELLSQALIDAEEDLYDILLIYKSDRLSRNSEEYPLIIRQFNSLGIEVWVYDRKEPLKIESQSDKLMRFIEGWQAETESVNTSFRVLNAMKYRAEQGAWNGGRPAYGYRLKEAQIENRADRKGQVRKRVVCGVEIDPKEAELVRKIFELYTRDEVGISTICRILNNPPHNARKRNGKPLDQTLIANILKNPVYIGRPAWRKTTFMQGYMVRLPRHEWVIPDEPNEDLRIVDDETWDKAQHLLEIRKQRVEHGEGSKVPVPRFSSSLLLSGLVFCGHCGESMVSHNYSNKVVLRDGTEKRNRYTGYICRHKRRKANSCCTSSKGFWRSQTIEEPIIQLIEQYFTQVDPKKLGETMISAHNQEVEQLRNSVDQLRRELKNHNTLKEAYLRELDKTLTGETKLPRSMIEEKLLRIQQDIDCTTLELEKVERRLRDAELEDEELNQFAALAKVWPEAFRSADVRRKRVMLKHIIERVTVYDDSMEVKFAINIRDLRRVCLGVNSGTPITRPESLIG